MYKTQGNYVHDNEFHTINIISQTPTQCAGTLPNRGVVDPDFVAVVTLTPGLPSRSRLLDDVSGLC